MDLVRESSSLSARTSKNFVGDFGSPRSAIILYGILEAKANWRPRLGERKVFNHYGIIVKGRV